MNRDIKVSRPFLFEVDYGLSLEEMKERATFDRKNGDINAERFPIVGSGKERRSGRLIIPGAMSFDEANDLVRNLGRFDSKIEDLLAFATVFPDEQRKYPIFADGSKSDCGGPRTPYLGGGAKARGLYYAWRDDGTSDVSRLLVLDRI